MFMSEFELDFNYCKQYLFGKNPEKKVHRDCPEKYSDSISNWKPEKQLPQDIVKPKEFVEVTGLN